MKKKKSIKIETKDSFQVKEEVIDGEELKYLKPQGELSTIMGELTPTGYSPYSYMGGNESQKSEILINNNCTVQASRPTSMLCGSKFDLLPGSSKTATGSRNGDLQSGSLMTFVGPGRTPNNEMKKVGPRLKAEVRVNPEAVEFRPEGQSGEISARVPVLVAGPNTTNLPKHQKIVVRRDVGGQGWTASTSADPGRMLMGKVLPSVTTVTWPKLVQPTNFEMVKSIKLPVGNSAGKPYLSTNVRGGKNKSIALAPQRTLTSTAVAVPAEGVTRNPDVRNAMLLLSLGKEVVRTGEINPGYVNVQVDENSSSVQVVSQDNLTSNPASLTPESQSSVSSEQPRSSPVIRKPCFVILGGGTRGRGRGGRLGRGGISMRGQSNGRGRPRGSGLRIGAFSRPSTTVRGGRGSSTSGRWRNESSSISLQQALDSFVEEMVEESELSGGDNPHLGYGHFSSFGSKSGRGGRKSLSYEHWSASTAPKIKLEDTRLEATIKEEKDPIPSQVATTSVPTPKTLTKSSTNVRSTTPVTPQVVSATHSTSTTLPTKNFQAVSHVLQQVNFKEKVEERPAPLLEPVVNGREAKTGESEFPPHLIPENSSENHPDMISSWSPAFRSGGAGTGGILPFLKGLKRGSDSDRALEKNFNSYWSESEPFCSLCTVFSLHKNNLPTPMPPGWRSCTNESKPKPARSRVWLTATCFSKRKPCKVDVQPEVISSATDLTASLSSILTCCDCGVCIHASCYGITLLPPQLPEWRCDKCRAGMYQAWCCLCLWRGGALKRTSDGRWAHLLCSLLSPGVSFRDVRCKEPIHVPIGLDRPTPQPHQPMLQLQPSPSASAPPPAAPVTPTPPSHTCELCKSVEGSCIPCNFCGCSSNFHPMCALIAGAQFTMVTEEDESSNKSVDFHITCARHLPRKEQVYPLSEGERVWGRKNNDRLYPGCVSWDWEVPALCCWVSFCDGSLAPNLSPDAIQGIDWKNNGPPKPGTEVLVMGKNKDGLAVPATFLGTSVKTMYMVCFDDGSRQPLCREDIFNISDDIPELVRGCLIKTEVKDKSLSLQSFTPITIKEEPLD